MRFSCGRYSLQWAGARLLMAAVMTMTCLVCAGWSRVSFWPGGVQVLENQEKEARTWMWAPPEPSGRYCVAVRMKNLNAEPGRRYGNVKAGDDSPAQGLCLTSAQGDTLSVMMNIHRAEGLLDYEDEYVVNVLRSKGNRTIVQKRFVLKDKAFRKLPPEVTLRISGNDDGFMVELGDRECLPLEHFRCGELVVDSVGFMLAPWAKVKVRNGTMFTYGRGFANESAPADVAHLRDSIKYSVDPMEGEWGYFDRQMDESLLHLGGDYRLLIVKEAPGVYNIYYLSGAKLNPGRWHAGMLKGKLTETVPDRYQLHWRDADGDWMTYGLRAALEEDDLLTLMFPAHASNMRFVRIK